MIFEGVQDDFGLGIIQSVVGELLAPLAPSWNAIPNQYPILGPFSLNCWPYLASGWGNLSFSITGLPNGLSMSQSTGVISGTLDTGDYGNHSITVRATNITGYSEVGFMIYFPPPKVPAVGLAGAAIARGAIGM